MRNAIAIMGIHTGIGKTVVSAILTEALKADYWKPVQSGELDNSDSMHVRTLVSNSVSRIHEEAYKLTLPLSPHEAANIDGIEINPVSIKWPVTNRLLLVETAGGVLSPMNKTMTMTDFISYHKLPVILVVQHYLGSINHTLMSIEVLSKRGVEIKGIIVNGERNTSSENYIRSYTGLPIIASLPFFENLGAKAVSQQASIIKDGIQEYITHGA